MDFVPREWYHRRVVFVDRWRGPPAWTVGVDRRRGRLAHHADGKWGLEVHLFLYNSLVSSPVPLALFSVFGHILAPPVFILDFMLFRGHIT